MSSVKQIDVKDYTNIRKEYTASGTITPGMLLELDSNGKVKAHSNAGEKHVKMFALADVFQGSGVDTTYATTGDHTKVNVGIFREGDEIYAILADGETVVIGDYLESNGDGNLKKFTDDSNMGNESRRVVAQALEAKDLSSSSGAESEDSGTGYNKRILVQIVG